MGINIRDFDWSRVSHIAEHGIEDYEVEYVILFDKKFVLRGRNETYCVFGVTENRRYLFVVLAIKNDDVAKIITAREMTKKEKQYYSSRR